MSRSKPAQWRTRGAAVILAVSIMMLVKLLLPGGLTRFGGFGEAFEHRYIQTVFDAGAYIKPDSGGYDGQFYAQIATDPSLQHPGFDEAIDEPAYRSRRILLPAIAHVLATGHPVLSLLIYCSLNILLWFGFAWLIWNWLKVSEARSFAKWAACVLSMGILDSVKYSLVDLPSMFLILLIVRYASRFRAGSILGMVASVFLKETNILAVVAYPRLSGGFRRTLMQGLQWGLGVALSGALFFLWYRYTIDRFGVFHGVSGNFDWPGFAMLRGLREAAGELLAGNWNDRFLFRILSVVGFLIQFVWLSLQFRRWREPLIRLGWVYAILFLFLGDLVWWGYWAVCRVVLPMTIAFNLLYNPRRCFWTGLILANLTVIHSVYRFI